MKKIRLLSYSLLLTIFLGCDSFVDVDLPDSQLTGATVFEDRNTAIAAMANVYSKLRDTGFLNGSTFGSSVALGLYTDELDYFGPTATNSEFLYTNSLLPTTSIARQMWNESYHQVYCVNAVLEGVANSTTLDQADRDRFTGEALFVRAFVHLYLVNVYGDIPYIQTTDYVQNRLVSRMPAAEVYQHIIADLEQAIELLPEDYISPQRVLPNRAAAYAVLARTYLYMGLWAEASNAASAVINSGIYIWETDLTKIFLKGGTTTIWQFNPRVEGVNTPQASAFIFTAAPPPTLAITNTLANSFDPVDLRKTQWMGAVTNSNGTWYYSHKYKSNTNTGTSLEYPIVLRLAEQYLIRAESRARQGELTGAKEDLDKIRVNAGLNPSTAVTATEIIAAVLEERRHELFTEHGHRFFDLKRTNALDNILAPLKPGWDGTDRLWPLPESELLANPNLRPQNAGY